MCCMQLLVNKLSFKTLLASYDMISLILSHCINFCSINLCLELILLVS